MEKFQFKYRVLPPNESKRLCSEMGELAKSIQEISHPRDEEELFLLEAKERIAGEAGYLEQRLEGRAYDFDTVLKILGVPREDIDSLRPWLKRNKKKTVEAIERLYKSKEIKSYELP